MRWLLLLSLALPAQAKFYCRSKAGSIPLSFAHGKYCGKKLKSHEVVCHLPAECIYVKKKSNETPLKLFVRLDAEPLESVLTCRGEIVNIDGREVHKCPSIDECKSDTHFVGSALHEDQIEAGITDAYIPGKAGQKKGKKVRRSL